MQADFHVSKAMRLQIGGRRSFMRGQQNPFVLIKITRGEKKEGVQDNQRQGHGWLTDKWY